MSARTYCCCLLSLLLLAIQCRCDDAEHNSTAQEDRVLSRRRRYLTFPEKAAVVLTISLLKAIPYDIQVSPTTKLVTIHELDVLFPLPHDPSPYELTQTAFGQPPLKQQKQRRRRDRRQLYGQLEGIFDLHGFDGHSCIKRALCETKELTELTPSDDDNLLFDLIKVIFTMPGDGKHASEKEACDQHKKECPLSLLDGTLRWSEQFALSQVPETESS